jgi:hypothetical protein
VRLLQQEDVEVVTYPLVCKEAGKMPKRAARLLLAAACVACAAASVGDCPGQDVVDLDVDRAACTAACNDAVTDPETGAKGHCCNNDKGVCANPSCTAGCHIAWYAATKASCVAECKMAVGQCTYTHPVSNAEFAFCRGQGECGCELTSENKLVDGGEPQDGCNGDSSASFACERGCELAVDLFGVSFYGRQLTEEELTANSAGGLPYTLHPQP